MHSIDVPDPNGLPEFVDRLESAIATALDRPPIPEASRFVNQWTWNAVFGRVEAVWKDRSEWGTTFENIAYFRPTGEPDVPAEELGVWV